MPELRVDVLNLVMMHGCVMRRDGKNLLDSKRSFPGPLFFQVPTRQMGALLRDHPCGNREKLCKKERLLI
jgi:hypothetical protein